MTAATITDAQLRALVAEALAEIRYTRHKVNPDRWQQCVTRVERLLNGHCPDARCEVTVCVRTVCDCDLTTVGPWVKP